MKSVVINLDEKEIMRMEAILLDKDKQDAFAFLKEVLVPKVREKGLSALDPKKGTGIKL